MSSCPSSSESSSEYGSDAEIQVTFEFDVIQENDYHGALQLLKAGIYSDLFPCADVKVKSTGKKRKRTDNTIESFVDKLIAESETSVSRLEYDDSPISLLTLLPPSAGQNLPILLMEKLSNIPPHCTPKLYRHFLTQTKQKEMISQLISRNESIIVVTRNEIDAPDDNYVFPEYEFFEKHSGKKTRTKGLTLFEVKASKLDDIINEMDLAMLE